MSSAAAPNSIATQTSALWIDLREVIRTFYGYPSALSFGDDVFESYVSDGYMAHNPRTGLGPHLGVLMGNVAKTARGIPGLRLGVECGDGAALSLVESLHAAGVRTFSVPVAALPSIRLALGQRTAKE